jgi:hypothetical protein
VSEADRLERLLTTALDASQALAQASDMVDCAGISETAADALVNLIDARDKLDEIRKQIDRAIKRAEGKV